MLSQLDRKWILFHIRRLSGPQFEDLCRDLLSAEGHQKIQHFGAAGSEKGVDILSRTPDSRWLVTQCKQVATLGPKPAGEALQTVIDHPLDPPLQAFRIAAPINYTRATREKLQEIGAKDLEIEPAWDGPVLLDLLEKHRDILDDLIGFIPSEAEIRKTLPFWNVPRRNDYFTGREELLDELEKRLEDEGSIALTQTITGLGGIGKTQIAIEYCHRQRSTFDGGVFWLDASSAQSLLDGYGQLAVDLGSVGREVPVEDAARAFLQNLAKSNGWLVVLDNADEPATIRRLLPPTTDGQVLITTRARTPGLGKSKPLPVGILPIDQATEFLLERSGRDENEQQAAEELARALDGLPLALEQAGAFLAQNEDLDFADYVEEFQTKKFELFDSPEEGNYQETVATTWQINFQKVGQTSKAAAEALDVCAFLAPDAIPIELFIDAAALLGPNLEALAKENSRAAISSQLIKPLTSYSLTNIETEKRELTTHRLVQQIIRQRLRKEERATEVCEAINRALDSCFPHNPLDPPSWSECARWLPHAQANRKHWPKNSEHDPTKIWAKAAAFAGNSGRLEDALALRKAISNIREQLLGESCQRTLMASSDLALVLIRIGRLEDAKKILETTLTRGKAAGVKESFKATVMSNLGVAFRQLGKPAKAEALLTSALEISKRVQGPRHQETLTTMSVLALTLGDLGKFQEAKSLQEEELETCTNEFGESHIATIASKNNLAKILGLIGEFAEAMALLKDAFNSLRNEYGENHPDTLTALHNLCTIQADSSELELEPDLVQQLLEGVAKLPPGTPIRKAAEARWLPKPTDSD